MGRAVINTPIAGRRWWTSVGLAGALFVVLTLLLPLLVVVQTSFDHGFANYVAAFANTAFIRSLGTTARLAITVTIASAVIGYPYAYAMARSGTVFSRILLVALMLSFWTSLLIRSYAWEIILNDTGVINNALIALHIIHEPLTLIRTQFATIVGMTNILGPFVILATYAALRAIPRDLELAARSMGATRFRSFWTVTFPLSLPGVCAGSLLVFVLTLGFYITPSLLGGPTNQVVGQFIVQEINFLLNTGVGAAMSVFLLVAVIVIVVIAVRFLGLGRVLGISSGRRS